MLEGISTDCWEAFIEMRRRIRAPLTPYAEKLICRELAKLKSAGQDPQACLEQSVMLGWRGVFPVRDLGITARSNAEFERYEAERKEAPADPERRRAAIEMAKAAIKRVV
mgnify:CR=1 FL=1